MPLLLSFIHWNIELISSLTPKETVSLVAKYKAMGKSTNIDFSRYTAEEIALMKAELKIDETVIGMKFTKDFSEFQFSGFDYIFFLHNQFKKFGTLPFEGGLADQPNKIIECFNVLSSIQAEEDLREAERQKREAKKQASKYRK